MVSHGSSIAAGRLCGWFGGKVKSSGVVLLMLPRGGTARASVDGCIGFSSLTVRQGPSQD